MAIAVSYNPGISWKSEFLPLEEDGTPSDLDGTSLRMHVRANIKSNEILAIASTDNGKIVFKEVTLTYDVPYALDKTGTQEQEITGIGFEVKLSSEDTLNMYDCSFRPVADIELTFPDGTIYPELVELVFNPNLSITRDFNVKNSSSS